MGSFGGVFVLSGGGAVSKAASGLAIGGSWAAVSGSAGSSGKSSCVALFTTLGSGTAAVVIAVFASEDRAGGAAGVGASLAG